MKTNRTTSPKGRVRSVNVYTYLVKSNCNLINQQQRRTEAARWGGARKVDSKSPLVYIILTTKVA